MPIGHEIFQKTRIEKALIHAQHNYTIPDQGNPAQ